MKKQIYSEKLINEIKTAAIDILSSDSFQELKNYIQHGKTSTYQHVILVCYYSLEYIEKHKINCDRIKLIRGALLHDYYLYDWHNRKVEKWHRFHGFKHAKFALNNAKRDFTISPLEEEIISRHMFPLNIKPPRHKEAIIVCYIDKIQSLRETNRKYQPPILID